MYKCINGWTKEKMKEQIKKYNDGTCSYDPETTNCYYEHPKTKNRCAIGCFIPSENTALKFQGTVSELFREDSNLKYILPLELRPLNEFQELHDKNKTTTDMHQILFKWIDENVKD